MLRRILWAATAALLLRVHLFVVRCSFADAPFRLLAFADPQLEGDTSIWRPPPEAPFWPSEIRRRVRAGEAALQPAVAELAAAAPHAFRALRKRIDLAGNDRYLAHIYRTLVWWTQPTHITVLGDLLGSQWIGDDEFARRAQRFARIFTDPALINIAGNHDVGYAGDLTAHRLARFEAAFGPANREIVVDDALRLVVLNSMNLDTPALEPALQDETYVFLNRMIGTRDERATILLTHIPLHKEAGICTDGPYFTFSDQGIREQNHLSYNAGLAILEGLFALEADHHRPGLILNGHDHTGCDVHHTKGDRYEAARYANQTAPGIREVTLRSMMGEFGGYAYLISAWRDDAWHFEVTACPAGVQHWWWAAYIMLGVSTLVTGLTWTWASRAQPAGVQGRAAQDRHK